MTHITVDELVIDANRIAKGTLRLPTPQKAADIVAKAVNQILGPAPKKLVPWADRVRALELVGRLAKSQNDIDGRSSGMALLTRPAVRRLTLADLLREIEAAAAEELEQKQAPKEALAKALRRVSERMGDAVVEPVQKALWRF